MAEDYAKELEKSVSGARLREHQLVGLKTILQWYNDKHGGIVADEMGLGKTCQAVGAIVCLLSLNSSGRHLVICPLSVMEHWENELSRFGIGKIQVAKYIGDADAREKIRKKLRNKEKWNVLLTTYEMMTRSDTNFKRTWSSVIVDEAHRLKSKNCLLHRVLEKMHIEFIVLLTGTPIQNNLNELYSLLSLVESNCFPLDQEDHFIAKYRNTSDREVAAKLQQLLSKYMFRRTKEMLSIGIPDSSELVIYHGITDIQKNIYRAILSKNYRFFEKIDDKKAQTGNKMTLLNVLMQLRKCVSHPYLFDGVEPEPFEEGDHLFKASGKFFLLDRLLTFLRERGHRVLIFSQMTRVLDIAQDYLTYKGYNCQRLDGSVRAEERFAAINCFQGKPETFCFLLSTRAGGLGLNLTAADTVIFLDSDFNPQNDIQAAARCHRIGQTKPVKIIRLVARYTVEEMIQCRAARKLRMTKQILGSNDDGKKDLTAAEISDLIIKGLSHLNDDEKTGSEVFNVEAIEKLVGKTDENGHWVLGKGEEQIESSVKLDMKKEEGGDVENMYIFEGHDYKQDLAVLRNIINEAKMAEQADGGRIARSRKSVGTVLEKRNRKPLSKDEIEERQRKRKEMLERREQLKKEEAERKKREQEARKAVKWLKNNYTSGSLPLPDESDELPDDDSGVNFGPHLVYGSVTETQKAPNDSSNHALVIHVVDDSGSFGHGGVFDALRGKSQQVVHMYELAGKMDDLHLGDAHVVKDIAEELPITPLNQGNHFQDNDGDAGAEQSMSSTPSQLKKWKVSVVLLVAQHFRKRDEISQDVLAKCLRKLAFYAVQSDARSVHIPRIGYDKRNISWYAIERLISRILVSKGIHTYVYYFSRRANCTTRNTTSIVNTNKRLGANQIRSLNKRRKVQADGDAEMSGDEEEEENEAEEESMILPQNESESSNEEEGKMKLMAMDE